MKTRVKGESTGETTEVVVPHDVVNEQVVVAAALVDDETREALLRKIPSPSTFLGQEHRALWTSFREIATRKLSLDLATLRQLCGDAIDIKYAAMLIEHRPTVPENLDHHVAALLWDARRHRAVTGPVAALLDALRNPREEPARVRSLAQSLGTFFDGGVSSSPHLLDSKEVARAQMIEVRRRAAGQACYPYGIDGLDNYLDESAVDGVPKRRLIPGAAPKRITVVTGLSGSGKTTLVSQMVLGIARQQRRVLMGAWEPGEGMQLEILATLSLGWSRTDLMEGRLNFDQEDQLHERMEQIGEWVTFMENPFWTELRENPTNAKNLDTIQGHLADSGAEVFVADLFERAIADDRPSEEKRALFRMQSIVQRLNVHGILTAQQRKDVELRPDKRPTREGIKGSGAWFEIADTMLATHREALWKRVEDNVLEIDVLKQRYGKWPLAVECDWDPEKGSISGGRSIAYDPAGVEDDATTEFLSKGSRPKKSAGRGKK